MLFSFPVKCFEKTSFYYSEPICYNRNQLFLYITINLQYIWCSCTCSKKNIKISLIDRTKEKGVLRARQRKKEPDVVLVLIFSRSKQAWTSPSGEFSLSPWPWANTSHVTFAPHVPWRLLTSILPPGHLPSELIPCLTSEISPWPCANAAFWPVTWPLNPVHVLQPN